MGHVFRTMVAGALGVMCLFLVGGAAHAQVQRTFVSTSGDDANISSNCAPTTPCRSFAAAIGVTNAGGEIVPLTSGGYGAVTIAKSLQITTPPGIYAGITVSSGNGITIAAAATDTVVLKGLTLNGLGTSGDLIRVTSVGKLHIENCEASNSARNGVFVDEATAESVFIKDSLVRDNWNDGVHFTSSASPLAVTIDNVRFEGNGASGFAIEGNAVATVSRATAARNRDGFFAYLGAGFTCDGCVAANNTGVGFYLFNGGGTVRVMRSTAVNNGDFGFIKNSDASGTFETFGTNMVRGNNGGGAQTSGAITTISGL